ncbi:MAG: HDOD domain-containing protein [Smithellaceae bacterium]
MALILGIVVSVIAGVTVLLALRRFGENQPENKTRVAHPVVSDAVSGEPSDSAVKASPVVLEGQGQSSVIYKDLKEYLKQGINAIFDENAPPPDAWSIPRALEDSDPQVMKVAFELSPGLSRFRAEQVRLQNLLNNPTVQMPELSKLILSDPVMTAKVLKMANSSYFGVTQKIDSISHALMILGIQNIKNTLFREGVRGLFAADSKDGREAVSRLWKHSNLTGICAQHFYDLFDGLNRGTLYTLGIVHDLGKLILMEYVRAGQKAAAFGEAYPSDILVGEEDKLFGVNHAVIGGYALAHWNFSELMVSAVQKHHTPAFLEADQTGLDHETQKYIQVLFLADQAARLFTDWNEGTAHVYALRPSYHAGIDKKKLVNKMMDTGFLTQLRAAEMIAADEHRDFPA